MINQALAPMGRIKDPVPELTRRLPLQAGVKVRYQNSPWLDCSRLADFNISSRNRIKAVSGRVDSLPCTTEGVRTDAKKIPAGRRASGGFTVGEVEHLGRCPR